MTTRHEFLWLLHQLLNPRGYLEIGVQHGLSLRLASCPALGIDPNPQVYAPLGPNARIITSTSDDFFQDRDALPELPALDLAFIDGMHLVEFAMRDFRNVAQFAHERTVVVFDDVLPRNQVEAAREQCPGDWTGDVWKVESVIAQQWPELTLHLVDTDPTGVLVVTGFPLSPPADDGWMGGYIEDTVPAEVLERREAQRPNAVINYLREWLS